MGAEVSYIKETILGGGPQVSSNNPLESHSATQNEGFAKTDSPHTHDSNKLKSEGVTWQVEKPHTTPTTSTPYITATHSSNTPNPYFASYWTKGKVGI
jgi:hypothetical protein